MNIIHLQYMLLRAMFTLKALGHGSYMTMIPPFLGEAIKKFMDYISLYSTYPQCKPKWDHKKDFTNFLGR